MQFLQTVEDVHCASCAVCPVYGGLLCHDKGVDVALHCFLTNKCPVISKKSHISAPPITGLVLLGSGHTKPPVDSKRNSTSASCHGVKYNRLDNHSEET